MPGFGEIAPQACSAHITRRCGDPRNQQVIARDERLPEGPRFASESLDADTASGSVFQTDPLPITRFSLSRIIKVYLWHTDIHMDRELSGRGRFRCLASTTSSL